MSVGVSPSGKASVFGIDIGGSNPSTPSNKRFKFEYMISSYNLILI